MTAPAPSLAELARTAVAQARVGTLTTYSRRAPARSRSTIVDVRDDAAGLVVEVRSGCPAVADLLERPLATVQVGPPGCTTVLVHGGAGRLPRVAGSDRLAFRVEPAVVRAGGEELQLVDVREYLRAEPDPLRVQAPALLEHLRQGHGAQLAACLRARGHLTASWVEPQALDRTGLVLTVLGADGVETVRLDFPEPVTSVEQLAPGLRAVLSCSGRCWCCEGDVRRQP